MTKFKNTFHSMLSDCTDSLETSRTIQHRHFIGKIYESDFNTESVRYPGTIAARIESALRFDEACLALAAARERKEV